MKVAFVHDWLVTYRGGEKVLESLIELYPEAPIYTLFYTPSKMPNTIRQRQVIYPRWLAPFKPLRKMLLPILPKVIESIDMNGFDLVISSSSCVAKGVITRPDATHVCYLHSPMRYIWDQRFHYLESLRKVPGARAFIHFCSTFLRLWDVTSSHRVSLFVANSTYVAERVHTYFGRSAEVVCPPVEVAATKIETEQKSTSVAAEYFICAGAMVPYKRLDLAVEACQQLNHPLVLAGSGPLLGKFRKLAGKNLRVVDSPDDKDWFQLLRGAKGLILPGLEDFGITPLEAMAVGTPVIAYKGGGALDFVEPGINGTFFSEQTVENLAQTLAGFSKSDFDAKKIKSTVTRFDKATFQKQMRIHIANALKERKT